MNTFSVQTHHGSEGVLVTGGNLDPTTTAKLEHLGRLDADRPLERMPRKCFPTQETYETYKAAYDQERSRKVGPEYNIHPDGSRYYNIKWSHGHGWLCSIDPFVQAPDAMIRAEKFWDAKHALAD